MSGLRVLTTYSYDAWGKTTESTITGAVSIPFRYTSREWDADADMYYYRARHYAPDQGRFLSREALKRSDTPWTTSFAYVANNPANYTDPQGTTRFYVLGVGPVSTLCEEIPWGQGELFCEEPKDDRFVGVLNMCMMARKYCIDHCYVCQDGSEDAATNAQMCARCCDCMQKQCFAEEWYCHAAWDPHSGWRWSSEEMNQDWVHRLVAAEEGKFCQGYCGQPQFSFHFMGQSGWRDLEFGTECDDPGIFFEWGAWSDECYMAWFVKDKIRNKCGKICWYNGCGRYRWVGSSVAGKWVPTRWSDDLTEDETTRCWLWVNANEKCPTRRRFHYGLYTKEAQNWWAGNTFLWDYYLGYAALQHTSDLPRELFDASNPDRIFETPIVQQFPWGSFLFEFDVMVNLYGVDYWGMLANDLQETFFTFCREGGCDETWNPNDGQCEACGQSQPLALLPLQVAK